MKPETKAKIEAANKRLAGLLAKAASTTGAGTSGTVNVDDSPTPIVEVVKDAPDTTRRLAALEKTVRDYEADRRARPITGKTGAAFTPKDGVDDGAKLGIDGNRFSLVKALLARNDYDKRGMKAFEDHRAEYERDALGAYYATKTMTFGDESSGGFLVPPEVRQAIDPLRTSTFLDKLPVQRYSGLTYAPVMIPRQTADNTSYWLGEAATLTLSDGTYDQIRLNPSILGNGTRISNMLLRKAPGVAESRLRLSIAASMERKFELAVVEGLGASGQPLGVNNITGINTTAFTSFNGDDKLAGFREMIALLAEDNVPLDNLVWLMPERVWQNVAAIQIALSSASPAANLSNAVPYANYTGIQMGPDGKMTKMLLGYPVVTSTILTASTTGVITLADWSQVIVADWGATEMNMTSEGETLAKIRSSLVTAFQEVDVQAEHATAICTGTAYTFALAVS